MPLHCRKDATRHDETNFMEYVPATALDCFDERYVPPANVSETTGVVHLVQGWIQQGNKDKGLYLSGDISYSSSTLSGTVTYYNATAPVARALSILFETVFPEIYREYREAFEAGVWLSDDPGPFLGRAVIYKLQGRLHKDRHDVGPSACFPVGSFTGGEMLFPQLSAKLS